MHDRETLIVRLREAVTWCAPRLRTEDPKWSLRSKELCPPVEFRDEDRLTFWNEAELVEHVVHARARLMQGQNILDITLSGGRLLLCYFDDTNHNYLSASESEWYFDGFDNPPWDSWIGCSDGILVSWVPPEFLKHAEKGVDVECVDMLMWADSPSRAAPKWLVKAAREWWLNPTLQRTR
jgi:hypothetical protein